MIRYDASAVLPLAAVGNRIVNSIRSVPTVWRGLTRSQFWWTLGLGTAAGLLFLLSHSTFKILNLLTHSATPGNPLLESTVALGANIIVAFIFMLAVRIVEDGDRGQTGAWLRYVVATLVAVGLSTTLVHLLPPYVPTAGLVGWYQFQTKTAIDSFVFSNWLLFGGLAVFMYVRLRRVRRHQADFDHAELERVTTSRQVLRSQLAAMQAQAEPRFLFNSLGQVEALYDRDLTSGDRMLDDLIAYLRAALPQLRGEDSTLARESELAEAYLRIVQARMGGRLEFAFDIPMELAESRFPPMLLLPLIENAVRHGLGPLSLGGRIEVRAAADGHYLRLNVSNDGLGEVTELQEEHGLNTLRERLAALYGREATLSLSVTQPRGITATLEVPCREHTSDHR